MAIACSIRTTELLLLLMTSVIDVGGIIAYTVHKIIFKTKQSSKDIQHENVNLRVLTMLIISSSVCMEYVHILQFF